MKDERDIPSYPNHDGTLDVGKSARDIPPAHYTLKIESFLQLSDMLSDTRVESYESGIFEACGYKWKLSLYPKGDKARNGEGYISLYLVIAETNALPIGWEVNVNFKLFVFDQIRDKYMTIQDANGKVRRFHEMKTEWGFAQLLPLSVFNDAKNGYLIHDKCVFGAEVFVINYSGRGECLPLMERLDSTHTWRISNFSALVDDIHYSDVFTLGNCKWKLELYPKGEPSEKGKSLSLFLLLDDWKTNHKVYAEYKLRIMDQFYGKHKEITSKKWFDPPSYGWGTKKFLSLGDLNDASKGFLVNDTVIVEADIVYISAAKNFS